MITALRLFLLPGCILFLVLLLHAFAARAVFTEKNLKHIVSAPTLYTSLATSITSRLNDTAENDVPVTVTGDQIQRIVEPYLQASIEYVVGVREVPPSVTPDDIIHDLFSDTPEILEGLSEVKKQILAAKPSKGGEENFFIMTDQPRNKESTLGFGRELVTLRQVYRSLSYLPWVFLGATLFLLVLIIILSPTMQSRMLWMSFSNLLAAIAFGVGAVFYQFSGSAFANMSWSGDVEEIVTLFSNALLLPLFDTLVRWNVAGLVMALSLMVIFFLARFMVFPKPSSLQKQKEEKKKKE